MYWALFDGFVDEFDLEYKLSHIRKDAAIINNKHFENGIAKIQDGLETALSAAEKVAVKIFLKPWRGRCSCTRTRIELCPSSSK